MFFFCTPHLPTDHWSNKSGMLKKSQTTQNLKTKPSRNKETFPIDRAVACLLPQRCTHKMWLVSNKSRSNEYPLTQKTRNFCAKFSAQFHKMDSCYALSFRKYAKKLSFLPRVVRFRVRQECNKIRELSDHDNVGRFVMLMEKNAIGRWI